MATHQTSGGGRADVFYQIRDALSKCDTYITDFDVVVAKDREDYLKQIGEEEQENIQSQNQH